MPESTPRKELPTFQSLTTRASTAMVVAAGFDPARVSDVRFEFGPPGLAFVTARVLLDDAAMARILLAMQSISAE